jgi:hypothetical protein
MIVRSMLFRFTAPTVLILAGIAGCDGRASTPLALDGAHAAAVHDAHAKAAHGPEVSRWLAGLRQATARFQQFQVGRDAGWDAQLTGCMELPGTGGMGYHYGNPGLIDGTPEALAPELLVYEPQKNGRMRLVAVEYIVPFDLWTAAEPPSLHGVDFHRNEGFGLWVLHAWVWKHNPAGMFADWNPNVSCAYAQPE